LKISTTIDWNYIGYEDWNPTTDQNGVLDGNGAQVIPAGRRHLADVAPAVVNEHESGSTPVSTTIRLVDSVQLEQMLHQDETEIEELLKELVKEEKDEEPDHIDFVLFGGIIFGICGTLFGTCAICFLICFLAFRRKKEDEEKQKGKVLYEACGKADEENPPNTATRDVDEDSVSETQSVRTASSRWFL
jgi:hypothetical protein